MKPGRQTHPAEPLVPDSSLDDAKIDIEMLKRHHFIGDGQSSRTDSSRKKNIRF